MKAAYAKELIGQFKHKRLLIIGDSCIDHYVTGVVERLNPEAPVPLLKATKQWATTGGAGNTAKNAAALAAPTTLISVVGADEAAHEFKQLAQAEGYAIRVVADNSRPTIRKTRFLAGSQQLLRVDYEEVTAIDAVTEKKVMELFERELTRGLDGVIVSDYAKGVVTQKLGQEIVKLSRQANVLVAADVKPSRAPFFVGASLISPNLKEGHEFLGLDFLQNKKRPAELAQKLYEKMQAAVYLTLGPDGIYVHTDQVSKHVPQEHVAEVYDVSGAGDTAIVALVLATVSGATAEEAAEIANAAGAVVVSKVGSATVKESELLDMVIHKHR